MNADNFAGDDGKITVGICGYCHSPCKVYKMWDGSGRQIPRCDSCGRTAKDNQNFFPMPMFEMNPLSKPEL